MFSYRAGVHRYRMLSEATIEVETDTGQIESPVRTLIYYTLTVAPVGEGFGVSGVVDSFTVSRGPQIPPPSQTLETRIGLTAFLSPRGQLSEVQSYSGADPSRRAEQQICDAVGSQLAEATRAAFTYIPETSLSVKGSWQDSDTSRYCRQNMTITATTTTRYQVQQIRQDSIIMLSETGTIALSSGEAADRVTKMSLGGSGSFDAERTLNGKLGVVESTRERSRILISVVVSGDTTVFTQQAERLVERLP
jgi:hypothetical protein